MTPMELDGARAGVGVEHSPCWVSFALARAVCPSAPMAIKVTVHVVDATVVVGPSAEPKPPLHRAGAGFGGPKSGGCTRNEQETAPVVMNSAENWPPRLGSTLGTRRTCADGAGARGTEACAGDPVSTGITTMSNATSTNKRRAFMVHLWGRACGWSEAA